MRAVAYLVAIGMDFVWFQMISSKYMTARQMKSIVKFMKANGVLEYKADGIEIKLNPKDLVSKPPITKETDPIPVTEDPTAKMPSDTDMMMWSTPAFDVTIETRKDDTPVRIM